MATARQLREIALSLEGTTEAAHFDRAAFKVRRIYVTLAADGKSANFNFKPDQQALKCAVAADAFSAIPNAWGLQGWTECRLSRLTKPELEAALRTAWENGAQKSPKAK
jgi:hypothetical protein